MRSHQQVPKTSHMRRTFWRRVRNHTSACRWWEDQHADHTWAIAAMRDASGIDGGMRSMAQKCWHHHAMTANAPGLRTGGDGMRGCARLSKRCMENGPRPFAWMMSVRIAWKAFCALGGLGRFAQRLYLDQSVARA